MSSRKKTIDTIITILNDYFANAPLKARPRARPLLIESVKQVTRQLAALGANQALSKQDFEQGVLRALTRLRDVHTAFTLGKPSNEKIKYLPFLLRRWRDGAKTRYVVARVSESQLPARSRLRHGAEVTRWDNDPIGKVVRKTGLQEEGAHPAASKALGLAVLTTRWAGGSPLVQQSKVTIQFKLKGKSYVETLRWKSITRLRKDIQVELDAPSVVFPMRQRRLEQLVRHRLFAPSKREKGRMANAKPPSSKRLTRVRIPLDPRMFLDAGQVAPTVEAERLECEFGTFGYVRIRAFGLDDSFVEDFTELLKELPQNGLILDLRESPGGSIEHAEEILQLLTGKTVRPTGFRFAATKSTEALAKDAFPDWHASIKRANRARRANPRRGKYSDAFPITDYTTSIGQRYYGPSVVLVDASTFSAAEMFAAGFLDNGIGSVIGAGDRRTGGAGANVSSLGELYDALGSPSARSKLFDGADFRFAFRQCVRINRNGRGFGAPFEGVGIVLTISHQLTKNDALNQGEDLLLAAARLLERAAKQRRAMLEVKTRIVDGGRELEVTVTGTNVTKLRAEIVEYGSRGETKVRESDTGTLTFWVDRTDSSDIDITGFAPRGGTVHYKERLVPPQELTDELERERAESGGSRRSASRRRRGRRGGRGPGP